MDDLISRQAAIDALGEYLIGKKCPDDGTLTARLIENNVINKLPPAQHERTPMQELLDVTADRDYWNAQCHSYEMTINRLTESVQPEISMEQIKIWLDAWEGYIDKDMIARMKYRVIDIPLVNVRKVTT